MSREPAPPALPERALAVIGMVGRFPGAPDIASFWTNLCAGREGVRRLGPDELDPSIPAALRDARDYVPWKGVIDDCDRFDHEFFGVTPLEAVAMDPQQRVLLELAYAALEDAGHPAGRAHSVGVFVGTNWNRYRMHALAGDPRVAERFGELNVALANEQDFLASRIAYKLDLHGPAVTVSTACSTSLVAIAQAAQALRNGECDLALAGGVSISVPVAAGYLHQEGAMLSADGHTRPFDAAATGTTFNDGAGIVVLRRLADAIADGDRIHAVVRGVAVNNDGADKVSFTAPSVAGQAAVIAEALADAGVDAASIGMIEAHGTATRLGDPIEVTALKRVFGSARREPPCSLGSAKSSIGHLVHAAGVAGFIKAVLAVREARIPGTLFFTAPNPLLGLQDSPFAVHDTLRSWPAGNGLRRAGVSSFGVGGTNAHVVIEQAPARAEPAPLPPAPQILCLSARSQGALRRRIADLQQALDGAAGEPFDAVAWTLRQGRQELPWRTAVVAATPEEAKTALPAAPVAPRAAVRRATVLMFTGQGAQRAGMGRALHRADATFRAVFDEGVELLAARHGRNLRAELFDAVDEAAVEATAVAQPGLFLLEYALARMLEARGLRADAFVGHSIGEFVAATLAGVFTLADALHVVTRRGELMQGMPRGSMLGVVAGERQLAPWLRGDIALAAANAPELSVVAGPTPAIEALAAELTQAGLRARLLRTSHAFHSPMMEPAAAALALELAAMPMRPPQRTIVSTVTGRVLEPGEATDPAYWADQIRRPVRFLAALDCVTEAGDSLLLEVGPGTMLTTMALQHPGAARFEVVAALPGGGVEHDGGMEPLRAIAQAWAHGAEVDWASWQRGAPRVVPLPTYPFERVRHWPERITTAAAAPAAAPDVSVGATADAAATSAPAPRPLAQRVLAVLETVTGRSLADADHGASWTELGFDSLLLTQVSTALQREFARPVPFRVLLEQAADLRELVAWLQRDGGDGDGAAVAPGDERPRASPGARIDRQRPGSRPMTRAQQSFVDRLIADYNQRTAASKANAQRHRTALSDPRTVSGFNPAWKEMVYPIVTNRSKGSKLWDLDGNEYIDLLNGFGPIFFGHAPDFVLEAVQRQLAAGMETGPQTALAGEVAELFCELTGNERVAFANTGSEAVIAALRLARTVTGRERIVVFEGSYHGIIDEVVARAGGTGQALPAAPGIPRSHNQNLLVLPYGTDETLAVIRQLAASGQLAAVMAEPVQSRRPDLQPREFLQQVRAITARCDAAMILDEVVTGFRTHPGGIQALFGIRADLAVYGKVVAGGFPIGMIGGRARYLDALDGGAWRFGDDSVPEVGVTFFAGTFVRHPVALAASKAVLERLRAEGPALQADLAARTDRMLQRMRDSIAAVRAGYSVAGFTSFFFLSAPHDEPYASLLWYLMRHQGVHVLEHFPSFLTTAHSEADIDRVVAAFDRALCELVAAGLVAGDPAAAQRRLQPRDPGTPPVPGARLGRDRNGAPAWFVADPARPGRFIQLGVDRA